ncbi:hypothetical protein [Mogibacterium sp. CM50]|uniref:hypothetical protein n=1 Tax=Mogibacterium sp. CM50 TaxID=936375 RepID=UPI0012EBCCCA|nr:hypothetical protein [Mogibacterium sp. CM50]
MRLNYEEKKKSIGDIVSYSDTNKGNLVVGIFLVSIGMIFSIGPIIAVFKIIRELFNGNNPSTNIINYALYGFISVIFAYLFIYSGGISCINLLIDLLQIWRKK